MSEPKKAPSPILTFGADPISLVLTLSLARRGVPTQRMALANRRATGVHAHALELYRHFVFADEVVNDAAQS